MKSSIARKLILYIVLFSSIITLVITALQLYSELQYDVKGIHQKLNQIKISYQKSITKSAWVSDREQLQVILDGIIELPDIVYAKVNLEKNDFILSGKILQGENIQLKIDLFYLYNQKNINIGNVIIVASLNDVYERLLNRLWIILLSNALKTFFVVIFIYFIFSRLVTRHLIKISEFSDKHDVFSENSLLMLERTHGKRDEFDIVVDSINAMHKRLHEQISEINHQKQYLSQTLNSIGDAVITTDNKGRVTRLNPVAEQLTGWTNEDALKLPLKEIFPIVNASTGEEIDNPVEKVLETGETIYLSNHTTLISKSGREYQIADSAAPIMDGENILGMVLIFNDVTEQYQMRQELINKSKQFHLINSQIPGIVYQFKIDAIGKKSLPYVSPAIEKYLGLSVETVVNDVEKWFALTHPDDFSSLEKSIAESLENLTVWDWEGRFIRLDGEIIWLSGTSTPERMPDGSTIWNGLFIDVTERMQADETARRSQKMDALGKLTGGIAHDYNNMLGVVLGYADMLQGSLMQQPKLKNYVGEIVLAAERGAKLTKKLLTFSANTSSNAEKLNINAVIQNTQHMLEKTLTVRIQLVLNLKDDLWPVFLEPSELEDAILNMSINAMHAIENNGTLTFETSNQKISTAMGKGLGLIAGDYVRFSLLDTGCGMDELTKEKVFDPFFTTKGTRGTGLGLSQVYGFINRSNGAIQLQSGVGQGTQFTLYFPRYSNIELNESHVEEVQDVIQLIGNEAILVVDDEVALLNLTCEILNHKGYHVFRAVGVESALEILEIEHIDLLLTDIIMPDISGYELCVIVQEKYPNIKIQLMSGFSGNEEIEKVDKILLQNMLHKPFNSQSLLKNIRNLLD